MDLLAFVAVVGGAAGCFLLALFFLSHWHLKSTLLPPGPTPWPVIGNLHLLGSLPHQQLAQLAQHYGPIFFLRLGSMPTIILSSPALAKETFVTQGKTLAYRPHLEAANRVFYPDSLIFMQYGHQCTKLRKLCTLELFTSKMLQETKQVRQEEIFQMLQAIEKESRGGQLPVNLGTYMSYVTGNVMCRQVMSRSVDKSEIGDTPLREIIHEMSVLFGTLVVGDFVPYLGWLDVLTKRRMNRVHQLADKFIVNVIAERERRQGQLPATRDFLDALLCLRENGEMTHEGVKALLLDLIAAGTDTTSDTMEWIVAELLRNPSVMRKLRDELDSVTTQKKTADSSRLVDESDIAKLTYLHAVIKETFRLHPVVPLLVPHMSSQPCRLGGYDIPQKTRVLVNVWAMGRSPNIWGESCEEFRPERFLGKNPIDFRGTHMELLPFGAGRRMCVGLPLAMSMVELVVANVVSCFDLQLPKGQQDDRKEVDMTEMAGFTTRKAEPLTLYPKLRCPEIIIDSRRH